MGASRDRSWAMSTARGIITLNPELFIRIVGHISKSSKNRCCCCVFFSAVDSRVVVYQSADISARGFRA